MSKFGELLLGANRTDLALGSMLLFTTNYLAILLTGSFVFGLMGYSQAALEGKSPRSKRVAVAIVVAMIVLVSVPLTYTSLRTVAGNQSESVATDATQAWLKGSGYDFVSARVDGDKVNIVVAGSGLLPDEQDLEAKLRGQLFTKSVRLEALPSRKF